MKHLVILLCCLLTFEVEAQSPLAGALGVRIRDKIREKLMAKFKERCEVDESVCGDGETLQPRKALEDGCDGYVGSEIPAPTPPDNIDSECEPVS